jgi:hypothetical protein
MGICGGNGDIIDQVTNSEEMKEVEKSIEEKAPEIVKINILKKKAIDSKKEKLLKGRNEYLEKAIANKDSNEDIKKTLKNCNLKELDIENKYFFNEVDKIHNLYDLGLDLTEPAKNAIIKQLEKKKSSCFINCLISRVKKLSPKEFLNSAFGKPLKTALEKQGMSQAILIDTKKELLDDRKKRREEEKTKNNLEQNEFPPDDDLVIDTEKIYKDIIEDYLKNNEGYKKYIEMKGIEEDVIELLDRR